MIDQRAQRRRGVPLLWVEQEIPGERLTELLEHGPSSPRATSLRTWSSYTIESQTSSSRGRGFGSLREVRRSADHRHADVARDGHGDHVAIDHLAKLDAGVVALGHDVADRVASLLTATGTHRTVL
jgi:hypothetical protein